MEIYKPLLIESEIKEKYLKKFKEDIVQQQQTKTYEVLKIINLRNKIKLQKKGNNYIE